MKSAKTLIGAVVTIIIAVSMVSCTPKATSEGIPATKDTVDVNPTVMHTEQPAQDSINTNSEKTE